MKYKFKPGQHGLPKKIGANKEWASSAARSHSPCAPYLYEQCLKRGKLPIARTKLLKQKYQGVRLSHLYQNSIIKTIILSGNTMFY